MALNEASWVDGDVQHTLIALASGFFLYVGLMEIVAKELVQRWGSHRSRCDGAEAQDLAFPACAGS